MAPNEASGLRKALVEGRIYGLVYEGECACLVGTIAKVRGCDYKALGDLRPDSERPIERWFMMFKPGSRWTPERHRADKITLGWIDEWIENRSKIETGVN